MKALEYNVQPARWVLCKAAGFFSRRAYYGAISPLRLVERPVPDLPGPGWVRLKTLLGGVCGSDLALITQRMHPATVLQRFARFPAILGHENVAVIDAVGPEVPDWRQGQRVCVEPALGCEARGADPPCRQCAAGHGSLCENAGDEHLPPRALVGLNPQTGGSWATHFVAHHCQLHAVPDAVPDDEAVLVDPIASAAHAVLRRRPRNGESILVNGSGIIALGVIASIRALGHDNRITVVVRHAFQADLARRLGATDVLQHRRGAGRAERYESIARQSGGRRLDARLGNQILIGGFDLSYECAGTGASLSDTLKWTRCRGTLVAVGTSDITLVETTPIWFDELEIVGANGRQIEDLDGHSIHTYDLVFEWLRTGRLDLSGIPVTRYRLSDYRTVLRHLLSRARHPVIKAAFDPHLP